MKKKSIFTIPNILSFFRLTLIPVIVWLYMEQDVLYTQYPADHRSHGGWT